MAVRTITARYPGTCGSCGEPIEVGSTINYGGRGAVAHVNCQPVARVRVGRGTRVYRGYSATGRRCEDAPCCGCCD